MCELLCQRFPIANSVLVDRTYITPSESAGVAMSMSPIALVETCANSGPAEIDHDVSVLTRQIDLSIGSHRRRAVAAADYRKPLSIDFLAGLKLVRIEHAVVGEHVELSAIGERCGHVGSAPGLAPCHAAVCRLAVPKSQIAVRVGFDDEDRTLGRAAARDHEEAVGIDGRWRGDLRALADSPQFLARPRVVAANELRCVGHEDRPGRSRGDRRRAPRWQLVALGLPHRFARCPL